uniref:Uncharacterized protein n=1 Tax=Neogobius melanostomus TaxID=47308 RepID=A0A8C6UQ28_9GOBI
MCTGACSKFVAYGLYPLAAISIICNIILFFPDFETKYTSEDGPETPRITEQVKYMGGLVGGGIMVLVPAIHIHLTSAGKCCANRCGMFLSIGFAGLGVLGAIYSLAAAALGLSNGPLCLWNDPQQGPVWGTPFANTTGAYLQDKKMWDWCVEPKGVVEFNLGLFTTLLLTSILQLILCTVQMVNGLFGCLCGTCGDKEADAERRGCG